MSWALREPTASWLRGRGDIKQVTLLQILYHILPNLQSLCSISFSWYSLSSLLFRKPQLSRLEIEIPLAILPPGQKPCAQFPFPHSQPPARHFSLSEKSLTSSRGPGSLFQDSLTWLSSLASNMNYPVLLGLKYIILCVSYLEWISSGSIPPDVLVVCIYYKPPRQF